MVTLSDGISCSRLLRRELPYRVLLPSGFGDKHRRYPVLYLLHGLFGDCTNWTQLTELPVYAADYDLVIVMPQGEDGWYVDSGEIERNKFESYFIDEFIPRIESEFRLEASSESRAVAGLSMGGYGAVKFALKYPTLFAFAGSISGAFSAPGQSDERPGFDWPTLRHSIMRAFGDIDSPTRRENDLFRLIRERDPSAKIPALYIDCGEFDGFLPVNGELHLALAESRIAHEYFVGSGSHDWDYWDRRIRELLGKLQAILT